MAEKYYYAEGKRVTLIPDRELLAVRYRAPGRGASADAESDRREIETALGLSQRVEVPGRNLVLLRRSSPSTRDAMQARAAAERLAERDDVEFATPVYQDIEQGLQVVPTDELNVRFKPGVTTAQILDFNAVQGVEIARQSEWSPQEYLLRVIDPKENDTIEVANAYYESDLTEWAEPNFLSEVRKLSRGP